MAIKITYYNQMKIESKTKAIFGIHIEEFDLYLRDIREIQKEDGSRFFGYPSKEYVDKQGEKKYSSYFYFGKDKNEPFQAKLRIALMKYKQDRNITEQQTNTEQKESFNECPF